MKDKTVMGVRTLKLTYLHPRGYFQIVSKTLCKVVTNSTVYEGNSISKLQIQVATYVFELSAVNCHR
jgi:hypothetical protein